MWIELQGCLSQYEITFPAVKPPHALAWQQGASTLKVSSASARSRFRFCLVCSVGMTSKLVIASIVASV